jgi:regulation of enolase protein 1 (concanavalin A-like superfamily)
MPRLVFGFIGLAISFFVCAVGLADDKKSPEIKGWGTVTDPGGDCTTREEKGRVIISVPGTYHDLNPTPRFNNLTAPRILQDVEGDFLVQVKVRPYARPKANTSTKIHSYVGAGLLVMHDNKSFIRFLRSANGESGVLFSSAELYKDGKLVGDRGALVVDEDTFLRLERQSDKFVASVSKDGQTWSTLPIPAIQLPKRVSVGVVAINSTTAVFAPEFEELKVTKK